MLTALRLLCLYCLVLVLVPALISFALELAEQHVQAFKNFFEHCTTTSCRMSSFHNSLSLLVMAHPQERGRAPRAPPPPPRHRDIPTGRQLLPQQAAAAGCFPEAAGRCSGPTCPHGGGGGGGGAPAQLWRRRPRPEARPPGWRRACCDESQTTCPPSSWLPSRRAHTAGSRNRWRPHVCRSHRKSVAAGPHPLRPNRMMV